MNHFRQLTDKEIATLMVYGCSADNWKQVTVAADFSPAYVSNVHFSGLVKLGTFQHIFTLEGGFQRHSGISNCCLHNCTIGNDVYISKINNYIANYEISDFTYIENVDCIVADSDSTFGNGVKVAVLNEGGGREVPIYNNMSAQAAYLLTVYRHQESFVKAFSLAVERYAKTLLSEKARIGKHVTICNSGTIRNVCMGDAVHIEGTALLQNGTINSNTTSPVHIGQGVHCTDFIISSGSQVNSGAQINRCFIGQAVEIGMLFTATDSLFFANSQCLQGEAVSVFAGPYTVTHHKSSLLIAGMYSFMNAGSATNQSNHMYKLGPVHQGIMERGTKTSSSSYVLWPARAGIFSLVKGQHYSNFDTTDLPFSYILQNEGATYVVPAMNLKSAGTQRDAAKWPKRDKRDANYRIDRLTFDLLNPFSISKIQNGIGLLERLIAESRDTSREVCYQRCRISLGAARKALEIYQLAIHKYIGDGIIKLLRESGSFQFSEMPFDDVWVDVAGMIAPLGEIEKLMDSFANSNKDLTDLETGLDMIYKDIAENENAFILSLMLRVSNSPKVDVSLVLQFMDKWKADTAKLYKMVLSDARTEFSDLSKIGYGKDGDTEVRDRDFEIVRGDEQSDVFMQDIVKQLESLDSVFDTTVNYINEKMN